MLGLFRSVWMEQSKRCASRCSTEEGHQGTNTHSKLYRQGKHLGYTVEYPWDPNLSPLQTKLAMEQY